MFFPKNVDTITKYATIRPETTCGLFETKSAYLTLTDQRDVVLLLVGREPARRHCSIEEGGTARYPPFFICYPVIKLLVLLPPWAR